MNSKIFPVILINFVNMVGFSILFPVLPFIIRDLQVSDVSYGVLSAIYPLCAFISAPVFGALSDTVGRRKILIVSFVGTLVGWIIFCLSYFTSRDIVIAGWPLPLVVIALSRAIDGITAGNTAVANALLADLVSPASRSRVFGTIGAASGLAILIAPFAGSMAASTSIGYLGTGLLATAITAITLVWMKYSLSETREITHSLDVRHFVSHLNIFEKFKGITKYKNLYGMFVSRAIFGLVFGIYGTVIGLIVIRRFGFTQANFGYFSMFVGSYLIFNQFLLVKKFVGRFGDEKTFLLGHAFAVFGYITITFIFDLPLYLAFYYVLNLGFSLIFPTMQSITSHGAPPAAQGEVMGISEGLNSAAGIVGPVLGGLLLDSVGDLTLVVLGMLCVTSFISYRALNKR